MNEMCMCVSFINEMRKREIENKKLNEIIMRKKTTSLL